MFYLDSHCHLNDEAYDNDLNDVIKRMEENGIKKVMLVSVSPDEYIKGLNIKSDNIEIKRSIGVFPSEAMLSEDKRKEYYKFFKDVDAIGEIGLDYHYTKEFKEEQKKVFIEQIKMANDLNKPIIVHSRDAAFDTLDILKNNSCKGVIHCFSESAEYARIYSKLGYFISLSGSITFKKQEKAIDIIRSIPIDKILIETDSPYLSPVPKRGERNEPSNVIYVAKFISEVLGMNINLFLDQVNKNYMSLFK